MGGGMTPVEVKRGDSPLVLGLPHSGTYVPDEIFARLTPLGQTLGDTDWHVDRLYDGLLMASPPCAPIFHRYVIDANRDPSGASLYPGQNTTGLVPTTNFDGEPLWLEEPDAHEIEARRIAWHAPYHAALEAELERVRTIHGVAILYDCHSIRSKIPYLFEGRLPDFNIGTNNGATCAPVIEAVVAGNLCWRGRLFQRAQWPLQGRLDHPPLRSARREHARHPDGTGAEHPSRHRSCPSPMTRPRRSGCAFISRQF
jgi:N-formylglutamate deformylase